MSWTQHWFGAVQSLSLVFTGGHAPVSWHCELARRITKLEDLSQLGGWVNRLAKMDLRLRHEPLWGQGLASLTAPPAAPAKSVPEPVPALPRRLTGSALLQQSKQKPDFMATLSPQRSLIKRSLIDSSAQSHAQEMTQDHRKWRSTALPRKSQVDQVLLRRLAGELGAIAGLNLPPHARSQRFSGAKQGAWFVSPPWMTHQVPDQNWLECLAGQVRQRLNLDSVDRINQVKRFELPSSILVHPPDRTQPFSLAAQWATRLNGQSAPLDLLRHLAHLPNTTQRLAPETISEATDLATTTIPPLGQGVSLSKTKRPLSPSQFTTGSGWLSQLAHAPLMTSNGSPQQHPLPVSSPHPLESEIPPLPIPFLADAAHAQSTQSSTPNVSANGVRDLPAVRIEPATSARIAPPTIAASLPPLQPPQMVNMPASTLAAFLAQQGAKQEESATPAEDLSKLAAQIKRILDEEARRYGIDV